MRGNQSHNLVVFCYQLCSLSVFGRITTLKWYDIRNLHEKREGIWLRSHYIIIQAIICHILWITADDRLLFRDEKRLPSHTNISGSINVSVSSCYHTILSFEITLQSLPLINLNAKKIKLIRTFRSLNVLVAIKRTEMGKNADESDCGTTNSNDPLPNILRSEKQIKKIQRYHKFTLKVIPNLAYLRFESSIRRTDHSKMEFLESYLQSQFY